ncbi:MAG: tetratricopeptide repeat protein [Myxococcota bacterium]
MTNTSPRFDGLWKACALCLFAAWLFPVAPVNAQETEAAPPTESTGDRAPSAADAAWFEEQRRAEEERDRRTPQVIEEAEREKVEVQDAPTLKYEDYRRGVEVKMSQKRGEMIAQLDQILAQTRDDRERPALLFQKAELFLEESQFYFFRGMEVDDQIASARESNDKRKIAALEKQKESRLEQSRNWVRDAVLMFQEIHDLYPKFERMPDVLFALGRAFWDVGSYKKALVSYREIVKKYPDSQYLSDAWLAFGEYFFQMGPEEERDLNKALDAYMNAAKNQDSPVFGYAVYKQGWCYYNLSRHDKAAERFKEVVLYSDINADLLGEKKIALAREARRDFVLAYAQYGSARTAPTDFKPLAEGEEYFNMLATLADIFYGSGKDRDAIVMYQILMQMRPDSSKNPLYQGKVVKLASRIGIKRQVVGQARKLTEAWAKVRDRFKSLAPDTPEHRQTEADLAEAEEVSDNTLRYLATTWHREAKKTRDDSTYEYAHELYRDYLDLFPEKSEAYEMRFFFAELLWKLERFEQAGEEYLKVYAADPKGKWAEPAAEEAVRAWDEVVKDYNIKNKQPPATGPDALKERPIPDAKKKLLQTCNFYVDAYPKGAIVVEAKYKVARTLYEHNYFAESTPRFLDIVDKHTDHQRAEQSANLVLDTYNILEDWQTLHDVARRLAKNRTLMKRDEFKKTITTILEEASFKLINEFEQRKEWEEAAKRYLAFTAEFPSASLADKALANAAAMFTRAGQLDRAIKVRIQLVTQFKASPLVPDQVYAIATAYEQITAYKEAADWLERFVKDNGADPRAKDALFNASIYRQGVGQTQRAIADREDYLKRYSSAPDAEDVAYSVCTAWEEAGNSKKAIEAYLQFAREWRRRAPERALLAQYRALRLMEKNRRLRTEYDKEVALLRSSARAFMQAPTETVADPLGFLAFQDAEKPYEEFLNAKIERADNPQKFRSSLQDKIKGKDQVYEAYTNVVKLKSPEWAVASLYRIGQANDHLATALTSVPAPKIFTAEQQMLFKDKLSQEALPIEDQATQAMVLCLEKSASYGVFNDWTRKCLAFLEEKRPDQFPRNALESRPPVELGVRRSERGVGVVYDLPAKGERVGPVPGTEPPPPPTSGPPLSVANSGASTSGQAGDSFDFDGEAQ